jgi:phosphoglycerate kinase
VSAITQFLPRKYAGLALNKEIYFLKGMLCDFPQRPMVAMIGGAKVSTKLGLLRNLLEKVDKILIGGGMVFTFFKAMQLTVGDSIVEETQLREAAEIVQLAAKMNKILCFATDVVIIPTEQFKNHQYEDIEIVPHDAIPDGYIGLDIGPQTIQEFNAQLESCATVIWNGKCALLPMHIDLVSLSLTSE